MPSLTESAAWRALSDDASADRPSLRALFADDPDRFDALSFEACGMLVDVSKNLITTETRDRLVALARQEGLEDARDRMFSGERINATENRSVLHVAHSLKSTLTVPASGWVPDEFRMCATKSGGSPKSWASTRCVSEAGQA